MKKRAFKVKKLRRKFSMIDTGGEKTMGEQSHSISTVMQIQNYIDEHLNEPITANDIAKAVGYSQYHVARIFKAEMGLSPFEYIRPKRLIKSAYALRNEKARVLDIALDFLFDSHEGFTRAFSNAFGITPKKYASHPNPNGWLIPYYYLDCPKCRLEGIKVTAKCVCLYVYSGADTGLLFLNRCAIIKTVAPFWLRQSILFRSA